MTTIRRVPLRLVRHLLMLLLLIGGFFISRLSAQPQMPVTGQVAAPSLLDQWLKPDVVIGGVLVLLYAGELRGDLKRMKADQAAINRKLHDDYLTKELAVALFQKRGA